MAFAKSIIHILEWMCFELFCTNVLVVGKIGKVLFSTKLYFLRMRNKTFCSVIRGNYVNNQTCQFIAMQTYETFSLRGTSWT